MDTQKRFSTKQVLKFLVPSAIGVFLFMMPVPYNGSYNISIAIITSKLTALLANIMPIIVYIVISLSALGYIIFKTIKPKKMTESSFCRKLFDIRPIWGAIRICSAIMVIMIAFDSGLFFIINENTGPFVVSEFLKSFITTIFFAGMLMTLLLDYGFMEFMGAFAAKVFRKVFTLPGRSSIDCITSWLGDAVVAVLITSDQYDKGYYSAREASVITTTFSAVSISFTLVILNQLGLENMFFPFFYTTLVAGLICAVIMPRIPPLSLKKDEYTLEGVAVEELNTDGTNTLQYAMKLAINRADHANYSLTAFLKNGLNVLISCGINTMPIVLFVGTLTLAVNEYTPLFSWLGYPFLPLLNLLGLPEAHAASACLLCGFGDNFVPSVIAASSITNDMTKFVVGSVSISQLIYMSQVGALILGSNVPVKFLDLFLIFIERTFICVIVVSLIAKFLVF
ncbi:MAG: YjiH family protein [Emergencia sp.]|nr:YjiH family protein [Emergencia sp.]